MKTYCYHVRDYLTGQKLNGGMLHAESLDDAAKRAIRVCKLEIELTGSQDFTRTNFIRDGKKVFLYVSIHPEYFLTAAKVSDRRTPEEVAA